MTNSSESSEPNRTEDSFCWLKNNLDFEMVYKNGRTILSNDKKIKARYLFKNESENKILKLGLSVISKKGNSVWRNRLKRILRETLIQNKEILLGIAEQNKTSVLIIFSPYSINQKNSKKIFLKNISPSIFELLIRLKELASENQI